MSLFRKIIADILNIPWTLVGLVLAVLSIPRTVYLRGGAMIFHIRSWWWTTLFGYMKGVRAMAQGSVVLLGPNVEPLDLEHELVHIEQHRHYPLIFPFLYALERGRGPQGNRFEREAYERAGNVWRGK